jgi:hypothetical protein
MKTVKAQLITIGRNGTVVHFNKKPSTVWHFVPGGIDRVAYHRDTKFLVMWGMHDLDQVKKAISSAPLIDPLTEIDFSQALIVKKDWVKAREYGPKSKRLLSPNKTTEATMINRQYVRLLDANKNVALDGNT